LPEEVSLPKIKINEVLLVSYTAPAQITRSTSVTDRETVVFRVLPKELLNQLSTLGVDLEYHMKKCLRPIVSGKLYFVKYPLPKFRGELEKIVAIFQKKYGRFAQTVYERREELQKDVEEFVKKYQVSQHPSADIFSERFLQERFRIQLRMFPIKLGAALEFDAISSEDRKKMEEEVRKSIEAEYREILNEKCSKFFQLLSKEAARLSKGKMVRAQTLAKLSNLHDEVATALAITEDKRYAPAFDLIHDFLGNITQRHDQHRRLKSKNKQLAAKIVAETFKVTNAIRHRAKPVFSDFKELVIHDIERKAIKRASDEGIKQIIASIPL